ncbi:hypothetical protein [Methylomonas albis]|nr:hypothetical protein [Methylomonas albis]
MRPSFSQLTFNNLGFQACLELCFLTQSEEKNIFFNSLLTTYLPPNTIKSIKPYHIS